MSIVEGSGKIAFYSALALLLRDEEFVESSADAVVGMFEQMKNTLIIAGITVDFLRSVYDECYDNSKDLELIESITESAFADLATYLDRPQAREALRNLMEMSGIDEGADLFVHTTKTLRLSEELEGPVLITLVVNNFGLLKGLLNGGHVRGMTHYSE